MKINFIFLFVFIGNMFFAGVPNKIELIDLACIYQIEDTIAKILSKEFKIEKTHNSYIGQLFINEHFIRDTIILKYEKGFDIPVGIIFSYKNNCDIDAVELPIKIVLDNKNKQFTNSDERIDLKFAIISKDKELINKIINELSKNEIIERIERAFIADEFLNYIAIKESISIEQKK